MMKKQTHIMIVAFLFVGICCLSGCSDKKKQAKTPEYNFTYSIFFPSTHGQCEAGTAWAKAVEERSNGRIKITVYPGGVLTKANQTYDGVINGLADIGMSCFAYTRGRFPVMEALDLPLGYADGKTATRVANAFYSKVQPKELEDVKVLYLHAHGPGLLHTQKPVRTLADIKGMLVRSTGLSAKVIAALGGVPVAKSQGETYEALQRGTVEGTIGPIEVLKGWRQAEVIKYTTDCSGIGYTTAMYVVMNLNKWNSMPEDLQDIITNASLEFAQVHGRTWDAVDEAGRAYTLERGNEIISLDTEEQARWKGAVQPVIDDYITAVTENGYDGQTYIDTINALIQDEMTK